MADVATLVQEAPESVEASVIPSGAGFRAVLRHEGNIIWRCPHVHFTDHSAKACNALAAVLRGDGAKPQS